MANEIKTQTIRNSDGTTSTIETMESEMLREARSTGRVAGFSISDIEDMERSMERDIAWYDAHMGEDLERNSEIQDDTIDALGMVREILAIVRG